MKRKSVIRVIIISLSAIAVIAGLIYFHIMCGYWWSRPDLGNDVDNIVIAEGGFFPPGVEYTTTTLYPESNQFQKITKIIESGWRYDQLVLLKVPSHIVTINNLDESKIEVDVFGNFIRIESQDDVQIYRSMWDVSEIIEEELKTTK
ncbi:hypothetical protein [Pontiella sulfatireligans]|uniref:Uncharacterized protein n=1 Tax=Pontiella sulfatireligans TaxID=2750658 RepID=A0A6C2UN68_9BACT|nr:hypothetical protein [Pontiella sulfatireligans]VGO20764.1 hypothetical protein SCARR_02831 [Pontiella sulfatireligans]